MLEVARVPANWPGFPPKGSSFGGRLGCCGTAVNTGCGPGRAGIAQHASETFAQRVKVRPDGGLHRRGEGRCAFTGTAAWHDNCTKGSPCHNRISTAISGTGRCRSFVFSRRPRDWAASREPRTSCTWRNPRLRCRSRSSPRRSGFRSSSRSASACTSRTPAGVSTIVARRCFARSRPSRHRLPACGRWSPDGCGWP